MKKYFTFSSILALAMPVMSFASGLDTGGGDFGGGLQPTGSAGSLTSNVPVAGNDRISLVLNLVSYWLIIIATIVIAIGLITFLWGVVQYITAGADEERRAAARNMMIYGIIGLFVMVAVWGLVYFVGSIIGIKPGGGVDLPGVPAVLRGS